jgi:hypothetical protein
MPRDAKTAFLIVNASGYPIYHDSANENAWSVSTQIHAIAMQMKSSMGQTDSAFRCVQAGRTTSVIGVIDGYQALVVSKHCRDSVVLLQRQAALACRILRLLIGSTNYTAKLTSNKNLFGHMDTMAPILHTAAKLTRRRQSFLVHAVDKVLLSETNRCALRDGLARASARHAPRAFHSMLFARGKLASVWLRDAEREGFVQPEDLLLLNLVCCTIRREARGRQRKPANVDENWLEEEVAGAPAERLGLGSTIYESMLRTDGSSFITCLLLLGINDNSSAGVCRSHRNSALNPGAHAAAAVSPRASLCARRLRSASVPAPINSVRGSDG